VNGYTEEEMIRHGNRHFWLGLVMGCLATGFTAFAVLWAVSL